MNVNAPYPYTRGRKCLVVHHRKAGEHFLNAIGADRDEWVIMPIFGATLGYRFERIVVMSYHTLFSPGPAGRQAYEEWFESLKLRLWPADEGKIVHL